MLTLKRSFFYTLFIFIFATMIIYLLVRMVPVKTEITRTQINPAQFISQKELYKQQNKASQATQQTKIASKQKKSQQQNQKNTATLEKSEDIELPLEGDTFIDALTALPEAQEAKPQPTLQESMLNELYGDDITKLSTTAKQYLLDNHLKMQIITQKVLNRIGKIYIDPRFHYYDFNYVEFTLYPDGHISDIKLLKDAQFQLLDKITKETIEIAFKDYPRPSEPTLVRYKFLYDLRSY